MRGGEGNNGGEGGVSGGAGGGGHCTPTLESPAKKKFRSLKWPDAEGVPTRRVSSMDDFCTKRNLTDAWRCISFISLGYFGWSTLQRVALKVVFPPLLPTSTELPGASSYES